MDPFLLTAERIFQHGKRNTMATFSERNHFVTAQAMLVYPQTRKSPEPLNGSGVFFLLVEAPAPNPGERKIVLGNTALRCGYAIENRSLNWCVHKEFTRKTERVVITRHLVLTS